MLGSWLADVGPAPYLPVARTSLPTPAAPTAQPLLLSASQIAVVFGKVARFDFPAAWPSLFGDLLGKVQGGSTLAQRRVFLALHHTLKELASKRLAADQRNFAQVGGADGARSRVAGRHRSGGPRPKGPVSGS